MLFGWVKDSDSADTVSINAEEVEQLDDILKSQDDLKDNIRVCYQFFFWFRSSHFMLTTYVPFRVPENGREARCEQGRRYQVNQ